MVVASFALVLYDYRERCRTSLIQSVANADRTSAHSGPRGTSPEDLVGCPALKRIGRYQVVYLRTRRYRWNQALYIVVRTVTDYRQRDEQLIFVAE